MILILINILRKGEIKKKYDIAHSDIFFRILINYWVSHHQCWKLEFMDEVSLSFTGSRLGNYNQKTIVIFHGNKLSTIRYTREIKITKYYQTKFRGGPSSPM